MTDPQQPPSGAVPPVPPAPQPPTYDASAGQPADQPAPPTYQPTPLEQQPAPPTYQPTPPAYQPAPPAYQPAPPAYQPAPPTYQPAPPAYEPAPPAYQQTPYQQGAPASPAAPPGAYQVPVGGYADASGAYTAPVSAEKRSGLLGILALVSAGIAALVIPIIAGFTSFEIGRRIPRGIDTTSPDFFAVLSPARDQVLWTEISFWTGTILGIAAIVLGIIAIRRRQGRGTGIAAIVVAAIAPVIFWVVVGVMLPAGTAAGFLP